MRITIHLVARLLRLPILRIDGDIRVHDEGLTWTPARRDTTPRRHRVSAAPVLRVGQLLAAAEEDLRHLDGPRRNGRPA